MKVIEKTIVMSDIHLGKDEAYLFSRNPHYEFNKKNLADLLKNQGSIDELVLNGDILELALAGLDIVYAELKAFFALLAQVGPIKRIVFIPGNHDHHSWRILGEQIHVMRKIQKGGSPPNDDDYTNFFVDERYPGQNSDYDPGMLLQHLWPTSVSKAPEFVIKYPHHLIKVAQEDHTFEHFLITHGHFLEDLFKPINYLLPPNRLAELEAFNNLWLEAFNYHLGHAGRLSQEVRQLEMQLKKGRKEAKYKVKIISASIYENLKERLRLRFPFTWIVKFVFWILRYIIIKCIPKEEEMGKSQLRGTRLDDKLLNSIKEYITKYIVNRYLGKNRAKFSLSGDKDISTPFTFVFGHTHIPFNQEELEKAYVEIEGKRYPVRNTGGWLRSDGEASGDGECAGFLVIDKTGANWKSLKGKLK